jgi:hypothetical protein
MSDGMCIPGTISSMDRVELDKVHNAKEEVGITVLRTVRHVGHC